MKYIFLIISFFFFDLAQASTGIFVDPADHSKPPSSFFDSNVFSRHELHQKENVPIFHVGQSLDFGSIVQTGSLNDGHRKNFIQWRPSLVADYQNSIAAEFALNIIWFTSNGAERLSTREIGRPYFSVKKVFLDDPDIKISGGPLVKLPIYDSSFGRAELYRVWQLGLGADFKYRPTLSALHFVIAANFSHDSDSQAKWTWLYSPGVIRSEEYTIEKSFVGRGFVGAIYDFKRVSYGLGVRSMQGIGSSRETRIIEQTGTTTTWARRHIHPVDVSAGEIFSDIKLGESALLHCSLSKTLKDNIENYGSSDSAQYAAFDSPTEISSLTLSLQLTKIF